MPRNRFSGQKFSDPNFPGVLFPIELEHTVGPPNKFISQLMYDWDEVLGFKVVAVSQRNPDGSFKPEVFFDPQDSDWEVIVDVCPLGNTEIPSKLVLGTLRVTVHWKAAWETPDLNVRDVDFEFVPNVGAFAKITASVANRQAQHPVPWVPNP